MKRGFVRTLPALLAIAVVIPVLTACSSQPAECEFPSGDASSVVEVTGKVGSAPRVDMPTPVVAEQTEVSTVVEGEGERLVDGQPALVDVSIANGATGEVLEGTPYDGGVMMVAGSDGLPPVTKALECASVGSRLVVVGTAQETHGGEAIPQLEVAADDSLVFIVDVIESFLPKADGAPRAGNNGDPAVVLAPNGRPGVTIPNVAPPETLGVSVLKEGDGEITEEGDKVIVHYSGFIWDSEEQFESTWEQGQPAKMELIEDTLIEGFHTGLIGKKVGSQVLIVAPPAAAYGDQSSQTIPANSTLVFVVDILGITE